MDYIVGAGLSGLIAAHIWREAHVVEASGEPAARHLALLRFRGRRISSVTGIPFREVTVHKGIFYNGALVPPSIRLANLYSRKVSGRYLDRSIWNLDPVARYIAPDDFYWRLVDAIGSRRISWGRPFSFDHDPASTTVLNTSPLPSVAERYGLPFPTPSFRSIHTRQYALGEDVDLHQTIYFPDPDWTLYRASITGSTLIMEHVGEPDDEDMESPGYVLHQAFGFEPCIRAELKTSGGNRYGKISPVDDLVRKTAILRLTTEHNIFSFGRYGCWRNILLDDLAQDAERIGAIRRSDGYETLKRAW